MANSYINILTFILTTVFYYMALKPTLSYDDLIDSKKFEEYSLNSKLVQCNVSFNKKKGVLRGMHYQIEPYEESKLVRCINGRIYDVIVDLRKNSKTFKNWFSVELSATN